MGQPHDDHTMVIVKSVVLSKIHFWFSLFLYVWLIHSHGIFSKEGGCTYIFKGGGGANIFFLTPIIVLGLLYGIISLWIFSKVLDHYTSLLGPQILLIGLIGGGGCTYIFQTQRFMGLFRHLDKFIGLIRVGH